MGRVTTKSKRKSGKRTTRATSSSPPAQTSQVRTLEEKRNPDSAHSSAAIISPWGRIDEEYALIKADLKRLLWVTAFLLILLVLLTLILR